MAASRHSIAKGDVVLCSLPPYSTQPWLSMGVVLHHAWLAEANIRARVVRPLDPPFLVPEAALHASLATFTLNPSMDERVAAMEQAYREAPSFFDAMVSELLAGPEEVFGLALFRNNADVSILVARLIKERRPSAFVVLGGPEAIEDPALLLLPWVDAVVGGDAEAALVPLFRALLDRRPERAAALRNVWLHRSHSDTADDPRARPALPTPPMPRVDYDALMPLFVGDREPTVPLLLNWGCPYHCSFCSNRVTYSRFTQGSVDRVLGEMDAIVARWSALHNGDAPGLSLQFSDATTNALPAQLDDLLQGVIDRRPRWPCRPSVRGQTLFDSRITEARVRLMVEANFNNTFFGLDSADDGMRRNLQKPGSLAHVAAAVELYHRAGAGGLGVGVMVGLPGETEAQFREAERFVDWAAGLSGAIDSITVLPYVAFHSAQDPTFLQDNRGESRGVLWRTGGPGGDPAERARRYMRIFEQIGSRVPAVSPIPPYIALPAMLPKEDPARLEDWMNRYGRSFDQLTPRQDHALRAAELAAQDASASQRWALVERALKADGPSGEWTLEGFERRSSRGAPHGLVALFRRGRCERREGERERAAILIEARDPSRRAFAQTRDFNISYLRQWEGLSCSFDADLTTHCVRAIERAEASDPPGAPS